MFHTDCLLWFAFRVFYAVQTPEWGFVGRKGTRKVNVMPRQRAGKRVSLEQRPRQPEGHETKR